MDFHIILAFVMVMGTVITKTMEFNYFKDSSAANIDFISLIEDNSLPMVKIVVTNQSTINYLVLLYEEVKIKEELELKVHHLRLHDFT